MNAPLVELVERVSKAEGPDGEINAALRDMACERYVTTNGWKLVHIGPDIDGKNEGDFYTSDGKLVDGFDYPRRGAVGKYFHVYQKVMPWGVNSFFASVGAAIAFAETMFPGAFWVMSKGRMRASEPLYAFQIMFGHEQVLGDGESNSDVKAIILAVLRALSSQEASK